MTKRGISVASYRSEMGNIHGAFHDQDAKLFEVLSDIQHQKGITGDVLEIGVYQGQSAILLGFLLEEDEHLHVCDRFDPPSDDDEDFLKGTFAYYQPYGVERFESTYGQYHDELPTVHACSSLDLHGKLQPDSFRFVHLDGSHRREVLRSDIALAHELLVDGGIMAFTSYRVTATLEVGAAVFGEIANHRLFPVAATEYEIYATHSPSTYEPDELIDRIRAIPSLSVSTPRFGDTIVPMVLPSGAGRIDRIKPYIPQVLWPFASNVRRQIVQFRGRIRDGRTG